METVIRFILSLSILVTIHELGHYIAARMFKTRVEKFYLFFDFLFPLPNVLNFALFKKKIGDTEYGIGWFPLGGYVKIAGMVDESMDEEQMKQPPKPDEFRSKKPWQRLIIMLGGIIFNILLAFLIYAQLLYWNGSTTLPIENVRNGFSFDSMGKKVGLQDGDKLLSFNGGKKFSSVSMIALDILLHDAQSVEVERRGEKISLPIASYIHKEILDSKGAEFASPIVPAIVDTLLADMALAQAGGKQGDKILSLDTVPIKYYHEFRNEIKNFRNQSTFITVQRGSDTVRIPITIPDSAKIGFSVFSEKHLDIVKTKYSFLASFPAGVKKTYETLASYIRQFRIVFSPELKGYKQVGSLITIAQQFSGGWDWVRFWNLTAFLSIALAFVNLLPIPALDGGHALFTLVEMITGRAPSDKFLERAQMVGMVIILALMVFALGNDFLRLFGFR